jgi:hypothetical protein
MLKLRKRFNSPTTAINNIAMNWTCSAIKQNGSEHDNVTIVERDGCKKRMGMQSAVQNIVQWFAMVTNITSE